MMCGCLFVSQGVSHCLLQEPLGLTPAKAVKHTSCQQGTAHVLSWTDFHCPNTLNLLDFFPFRQGISLKNIFSVV